MFVIFLQIEKEYLDVSFGTEEDAVGPELSVNYVVFFEVYGEIQQTVHDETQF